MNYAKLFFITSCTMLTLQAKKNILYPQQIEQTVKQLLQKHFENNLYENLTYTEELFMNIKQDLFDKNYITEMPHKDLKSFVKINIKDLKKKKYNSRSWFLKHKKELSKVIQNYFNENRSKNIWGIYKYLNTCSNKVCKNLQETMHRDDILPVVLNNAIKSLITQLQSNKNVKKFNPST